jgi:hypothetical protein
LLLFLNQEVPSLQIFNTSQIETLSGLNNQLVGIVQQIDQTSSSMPPASVNKFRMILKPLVNEVATLQQKLEGINTPGGRGSLTTFGIYSRNDVVPQAPGTIQRTPARTPANMDFFTPAARTPNNRLEEGFAQTVPTPTSDTPEPRRSGRHRRQPERYGAGIGLIMPSGGALTHRRFL